MYYNCMVCIYILQLSQLSVLGLISHQYDTLTNGTLAYVCTDS